MKNLVVGVVGDTSLHRTWVNKANRNFDLFLIYYGDKDDRYLKDAKYYDRAKGTKFVILDQILRKHGDIFSKYDAVFVPDDDIHMEANDIEIFLDVFHKYNLWLAQPSIVGWYSLHMVLSNPDYVLRFTNWVEVMTPCFSRNALELCRDTFMENRSNWGIDYLWSKMLGYPTDKIAIVDKVAVVHTRPTFFGDTYHRNNTNYEIANRELNQVIEKHNLDTKKIVYGGVPVTEEDYNNLPSEEKFFPPSPSLKKKVSDLHSRRLLV